MTYNRPCDHPPTIHCRKKRSWKDKCLDAGRIVVAIGLICSTIAEDVVTAGGGVVDDPLSIAAAIILIGPPQDPPVIIVE